MTSFGILSTAINTFYNNEEARIQALGLGVEETTRLLAENDQSRREEFRGLSNITNQFAEDRIRTEERTQDAITDLRDDALDAEADRLQSIEDLHDRHLMRVLGLETRFSRDLDDLRRDRIDDAEDIALEYQRDLVDLQNRFTRSLFGDAISFADLTADQQLQVTESTGFQRGVFDLDQGVSRDRQDLGIESGILRPGSPGYNFYRQQIESGELTDDTLIERLFGREGLDNFLGLERGTEDAATQLQQGILDANEAAGLTLVDILGTLGSIDENLSLDSTFENIQESIELGLTPFISGITEIFDPLKTGVTAIETLAGEMETSPVLTQALTEPSAQLTEDAMMTFQPPPTDFVVETMNVSAGTVNVSGGTTGGAGQAEATPGAETTVSNNITIVVDFGDGVLTKVEGRLATRADQGLSVLNV